MIASNGEERRRDTQGEAGRGSHRAYGGNSVPDSLAPYARTHDGKLIRKGECGDWPWWAGELCGALDRRAYGSVEGLFLESENSKVGRTRLVARLPGTPANPWQVPDHGLWKNGAFVSAGTFTGEEAIANAPMDLRATIPYNGAKNRLVADLTLSRHKKALQALCIKDTPAGYLDLEGGDALEAMADAMHKVQSGNGIFLTHMVCNCVTLRRLVDNANEHGHQLGPPSSSPGPYAIRLPDCGSVKVVVDREIPDTVRMLNPSISLAHYSERYLACEPQSGGHVAHVKDHHQFAAMCADGEAEKRYSATLVVKRPDGQAGSAISGTGAEPPREGRRQWIVRLLGALARPTRVKWAIDHALAWHEPQLGVSACACPALTADERMARALDPVRAMALHAT